MDLLDLKGLGKKKKEYLNTNIRSFDTDSPRSKKRSQELNSLLDKVEEAINEISNWRN